MGVFQHPYLTRGIVQTAQGAFAISRGCVEMADDLGESLGWRRLDRDGERATDERSPRGPSEGRGAPVELMDTSR